MGFSRQEYWSGLPFPFPVDHILSDLPPWPARLGWPHKAWLSFIELDKAVVHVIRLTSLLWVWFQCVCPLMPPCNTYRLTGVSLTLDMGYLFMAAPESAATAPYLGRGVFPHGHPTTRLHILLYHFQVSCKWVSCRGVSKMLSSFSGIIDFYFLEI